MNPSLEQGLRAVEILVHQVGVKVDGQQRRLLLKPADSLNDAEAESLGQLIDALYEGFFHCAATGYAFVPPEKIRERFGSTLEQNYPGASASFLRFATTYWTFKIMQSDLCPEHGDKFISQLFSRFELEIGSVFFPMPGPLTIPTHQREQKQRELIAKFGAQIDIDDFIRGNPILKGRGSQGCLTFVIALLGLIAAFVAWAAISILALS